MALPPFFTDEEYRSRLEKVRRSMERQNLDTLLVSSPENIFYLVGLSHQGHFAYQLLVVPRHEKMILITRAMERVVVEDQVYPKAAWFGFADHEDPAAFTVNVLKKAGLGEGCIGLEKDHAFFPLRIAEGIQQNLSHVKWVEASGTVEEVRLVKSSQELSYTKKAAKAADAGVKAAIQTARVGVNLLEVAAEAYRAMILAGGHYPGFTPLVRSTPTLGQEHGTWIDYVLKPGDPVFVNVGGCYLHYHAPATRIFHMSSAPPGTEEAARLCLEGASAAQKAMKPGVLFKDVYRAWQDVMDAAGLSHYKRHHVGYTLGIGFPPSWVGGGKVAGMSPTSEMVLRPGMVFHLEYWLVNTGRPGTYAVSDAGILAETGVEVLTTIPRDLTVI